MNSAAPLTHSSRATDYISVRLVSQAAKVARYAPVQVPGVGFISDRDAWRYIIGEADEPTLWALLGALEAPLVASLPALHARLLAEVDDDDRAAGELLCFGDVEGADLVERTLELLPPRVARIARREACWLSVGWSSRAWTSSGALLDTHGRARRRLVVVCPRADATTIAHEIVHVGAAAFAGAPADRPAIAASGERGLADLMLRNAGVRRAGRLARIGVLEEEVAAVALSLAWVFGSHDPGRVS